MVQVDTKKTNVVFVFLSECRFLRGLGGDAVGMSTVPEIVAAHHCNMQILCLSL